MIAIVSQVGLCFVLPLLLCLLVSGQWRSREAWLLSLGATAALLVSLAASTLLPSMFPKLPLFNDLKWNWLGKCASILTTIIVFALFSAKLKSEAGLLMRPTPPEWISVAAVCTFLIGITWMGAWIGGSGKLGTSLETIAFQATMPGLDEESSFRGTILAMLVGVFGKPVRFAGIRIGWGALPIVAYFGLCHGFSMSTSGIQINWPMVLTTGVLGVGLLWLKERTNSIWIPVLVHNLINVGVKILSGKDSA